MSDGVIPRTGIILEGRNVRKTYYQEDSSELRILEGVDVAISASETVAIIGASGSGKSTLLHLLGGLDKPTSGDVMLEGAPLSSMSDKQLTLARRHRIGFVFQFFNLVPVLSVEENISLPAVIDGKRPSDYRAPL